LKETEKFEVMVKDLLPEGYEGRGGQVEFIEEASMALENKEVFFGSAPCGIGKSLASLLTVLPRLGKEKLLICFRTRSQLHIYLKELKAVAPGISAVSFISKRDMCPRIKTGFSYYDFLDECSRLRKNCENKDKPYCEFYSKNIMRPMMAEKIALDCSRKLLPPLDVTRLMSRNGFCAYEAMKRILARTDVFLGTYHYAFEPLIRGNIIKNMDADLSRIYLVVDEAHNLPRFARELLSDQMTERTVERAIGETDLFEHSDVLVVLEYLETLEADVYSRFQDELEKEEIRRVDPLGLDEIFLENCGVSGLGAAETILDYGEHVTETRRQLGYETIYSYNRRVGEFLLNFFKKKPEKYLHVAQKDGRERTYLKVMSFDGRSISDPVLRGARGSILMSGFLSPLEVYRDLILYDENGVRLREFDSPFPPENRLILAAVNVSSRYSARTGEMLRRWKEYIEAILKENRGNVAVFATSYQLMHRILKRIETDRNVITERSNTRRDTVLKQLKNSNDNALFGVMGGKLSEGVDYPGDLMTCVVAVGLPYATWNVYQRSLINYYSDQYPGMGRVYAYITPAILRLIQACGRVHRSAADKGCIIILDERVSQPDVTQLLPSYFQNEMKMVMNPSDAAKHISSFWRRHGNVKKNLR